MTEHPTPLTDISRRNFLVAGASVGAGVTLLGLSGCGDSGSESSTSTDASGDVQRGGILKLAITDAANTEKLDPATTAYTDDGTAVATMYEGLVKYNVNWEVEPLLAESWEVTDDATEWTFKLREGVTFHDGSPLTADDVIYTIERNLDPKVGSAVQARFKESLDASGMEAVDDLTVKFTLKRPDSLFTLALGARQAQVVKAGTTDFNQANGTGPFKLVSFKPGTSWEVEKNPDYWDPDKPYLDGIQSVVIPEQATKVQAVVSGDAHVGDQMDATLVSTVEGSSTSQVLKTPSQTFLDIALDSEQEPFTDPNVIMAMKLAAGRQEMLTASVQGLGTVTSDLPEPPDDPFFPESIGIREQDIEGAKAMLAEAGYPDGIDVELFTSEVFGGLVDMATTFQQTVEPAGIRVKINKYPAKTYWDDVWLKKPMYCSYYQRRHPNEALSLTYISDAAWNEGNYKSEELDGLVEQGLATSDEAEQQEIYSTALALVSEEAGMLIPFFIDVLWPAKNQAQGVNFTYPQYVLFGDAWLSS